MPAHDGAKTPDELFALLDTAVAQGGWLVLLFHGVGGDHLPVERETHDLLLTALGRRQDEIWTERFGTVAAHVVASRERGADEVRGGA